jgi:hypothetical protein
MKNTENSYHRLAQYLKAAYTAYFLRITLAYALKQYVEPQELEDFWYDIAERLLEEKENLIS